jgi:hypothetical protein
MNGPLHWDSILFLICFGVIFVLEVLSVYGCRLGCYSCDRATISYLVFRFIPRWLRAMLLGWLAFHFLVERQF